MKKVSFMLVCLLVFSSIFPTTFLANMQEDTVESSDDLNIRSEEEVKAENNVEILSEEQEVEQREESVEEEPELDEKVDTFPTITKESKKEMPLSSESEVIEEEFNEFGIKKGTMLFGEDISELSEWELQYVPEGWRDGVVESEHPEEAPAQSIQESERSVYPNVNNYIRTKNFKAATTQYDHKDFFTKFNYRGGYGKVEGVVAHETANNQSNIFGEIAFMSRNHKNAFVHAFVDHSQIIEIHPTELGAWGAGRFANQRFVHVELVRVHSFDEFARSINNYSEYIARVLYQYNLGVSNGDVNGKGTLWSHRAVSNFLGGTTHVDPHGYFARWGYNWTEFVKLVSSKYNTLAMSATIATQKTSQLGHIRNENVNIYPQIGDLSNSFKAGKNYTHKVYYIKEEATIQKQRYYLLSTEPSNKKGVLGWVKSQDLSTHAHVGFDKKAKKLYFKGKGSTYDTAWGGAKNLVHKNLNAYTGQVFDVHLTEKVGNNTWYRGKLNGKTMWIHSSYLDTKPNVITSKTSKLGHIRNTNVQIYDELGNTKTAKKAGTKYTHAVYYIKQEAKFNGQLYHLLSTKPSSENGVIGWVKAQDLSSHAHVGFDKKAKKLYFKGTGSAYDTAWGGNKNLTHKSLSAYKNQVFQVHLTEKVGKNTWYRGKLNGKTIWVHEAYLKK